MKALISLVAKLRVLIGTVTLAVLLLIALLLFLHSTQTSVQAAVVAASDTSLGNTLRMSLGEPSTLDPVLAAGDAVGKDEMRIVGQVFEGLVRLDENSDPTPALASSWSYSADMTVYTFTLREAYFTNGRRVVAADVVSSVVRALSPTINRGGSADLAYILYDIQGAEQYNNGNTSVSIGVRALAQSTVRFDLAQTVLPVVFLKKLALPIAGVVPLEEINAGGTQWWHSPVHLIGTGPFKMTEWITGDHISLAANPQHYAGPPPLSGLTIRFITDTNIALNEYRANRLDILAPGTSLVTTITTDPVLASDLITSAGNCTYWSLLDNQQAPFSGSNGMKLRQAFNYAIDKTMLISGALSNIGIPAKGVLPPSAYGYSPTLQGLDFSPVSAAQRLAESGYMGTPQIVMRHIAQRFSPADNIRSQLLSNLTVTVVLSTSPASYQMRLTGWCADYPDPESWLVPVLRTYAGFNQTHYSNPAFDALVDQAAHTITESERIVFYQQAEQLAVSEAALLPLWHNQFMLLKKPWVLGPIAFNWPWNHPFDNVSIVSSAVITPGTDVTITADANVSLHFPPNAFAQPAVITYSAIAELPTGLPGNLMGAGYTMILTGAYSGTGTLLGLFQAPVTLTIQYTLPSTMRGDTLRLYTWNGNAWVAADTCGGLWIDTNASVFQVALCHFSKYALVGQTYRIYLPFTIRN